MKLYRRMVKPVIMFPDSRYRSCYKGIPDENWHPEEDIPTLKEKYKHLENTFEHIVFDERYEVQEPRVLTLEELEDWDGAVFLEVLETDMYYALIETVEPSAGMKGAYVFINVEHGEHYWRVWDGEHYGSIWRCWTERPTDAQREVTPWA